MRITVLRTYSTSCVPIYEPLRSLGHELAVIIYNHVPFADLPAMVEAYQPDWVLMLGNHDAGVGMVPPVNILASIAKAYPFVHLCCDGSETIWWPQLQQYYDEVKPALQINIDGAPCPPIDNHPRGMTALCPIDPAGFRDPPRPWDLRDVRLGFCGSCSPTSDHPRSVAFRAFEGLLTIRNRDSDDSTSGYRDFLSSCRCVWNHAATGTGDRMHVKARVIETALAGAVVLDTRGSPTSKWFTPGEDYLTYQDCSRGDVEEATTFWIDRHPSAAYEMAMRMRNKVIRNHAPGPFWQQVVERISK